jgi:Spy/CpxP family protein refolding chaperone
MRPIQSLFTIALIALAGTNVAAANPVDAQVAPEPQPTKTARQRNGAQYLIDNIDKIVELTEEQKEKFSEICDKRAKESQEWMAKNAARSKAADKAMSDAYATGDQEAIARAREDFNTLHAPMIQMIKKSQDDLAKVLTREQQAKLDDYHATNLINARTAGVKLLPDQVKQLKAAYRETQRKDKPDDTETMEQAFNRILLPEQKAAIAKSHCMHFVKAAYAKANLTDAQLKKIGSAVDEIVADPEQLAQRFEILQQRMQTILTKEQITAMAPPQPQAN